MIVIRLSIKQGTIFAGCVSFVISFVLLVLTFKTIIENGLDFNDEESYKARLTEVIFLIILNIVLCPTTCLLLVGTYKGNRWLLVPWIIVSPIYTIVSITYMIINFKKLDSDSLSNHRGLFIGEGWLQLYFLCVVTRRFLFLKRENDLKTSLERLYAASLATSTTDLVTDDGERVV